MMQVYGRLTGEGQGSLEVRKLLEEALRNCWPELTTLPSMEKDSCGKPYFPDYPWIHFNLSHTRGFVCCALSETEVGVDVERRRPQKYQERILGRFSEEEQRLWRAAPSSERERLFFRMWVLKESYVKADGRGLRIPLDSFSVLPGGFRGEERKKSENLGETAGERASQVWQIKWKKEPAEQAAYGLYLFDLGDLPYELGVCVREPEISREPGARTGKPEIPAEVRFL